MTDRQRCCRSAIFERLSPCWRLVPSLTTSQHQAQPGTQQIAFLSALQDIN